MLILIVAEGPDKGRIYEWADGQTVIVGRESKDLRLSDGKASRQHARFKCEGGKWYVRDLASRHGTLVNKIKTEGKTALNDGDRVQIGRTHLVVARVPAEQAERVALLGGQPAVGDSWAGTPTYRRFIPRASTAAAVAAAAFAVGCSGWLYMNTTDANLKLREDLLASQSDATGAQLAATEAQTRAAQSQLAMADRTDEIFNEVQALSSSSTPVLNDILASVQSQNGNNEQLDEISLALAELHDTSQPTLDAILARVESQSSQWMTLAEVRDVMKRQQADTAELLPELQAVALATRANEQTLDVLRQQIEQAQARPDLDGKVLDELEAVVAELQARPTLDQVVTGVRRALAQEQQKTDALLNRIEDRLAKRPGTQELIAPLRQALTSQAQATEQLVAQAFEQRDQTTKQLAELKTLVQSQPGETVTALGGVAGQINDHGDLDAVLAAVKQIEAGAGDTEAMDLLRELALKLESAPTSQQLAEAVALAVTDQLDATRPMLEQIASSLESSAQQDETGQVLLEQVRLALQAQSETDARLDQIYDLLASSNNSGADNDALRQVLAEIRTKSIAGMDELRSTISREIQAGLTEQRLAGMRDPRMTPSIAHAPIATESAGISIPTRSTDTLAMATPQVRDTIRVDQETPVSSNVLTDVEQAYRIAFKTGKPITLGGGSVDAETGMVTKGRTLDPTAAMAAGITDWRDWYLMDDFAERMRLQQQAVKYHNDRHGKLDIIGIPDSASESNGDLTPQRGSGG